MTSHADRVLTALRAEHDAVTAVVRALTPEQLTGPSGATEWTLAQVLSHLGSGAEITLAGLQAALGQREAPAGDFNPSVWDRWDAMEPEQQRAGFLEHDAALVEALEALDAGQRDSLRVHVGFAPEPLTLAAFGGMRLHEAVQHGWDVRVALDSAATLDPDAAAVLVELFSAELGFLLGFIGEPDVLTDPVVLDLGGSGYGLSITNTVTMTDPVQDPTAHFDGALEAAVRMIAGRLRPEYTPAGLGVSGNVSLDTLRVVFPGF